VRQAYQLPPEFFLYVGSVEARKNLKLIIEAYHLGHTTIKIPIVVIGKGGQYKLDCKKMIAQYGLEHCFIWLENVNDNLHLQSIYQLASALIYPSFYEGFGLPIAEALLSKTPVIAAHTSSLCEAGGAHSLYIHPQKAQELKDAMLLILDNKEHVAGMRKEGYAYALSHFLPETVSAQMMSLYENL
jgi:glycosyltransferase involved in cell wall biosynthesis